MTAQESANSEIEKLVMGFKGMPIIMDEEIDRRVYVLYGWNEEDI